MTAVLTLLPIAFVLSLDNFQSSIGLGTTKPSWIRIVQCALIFGVFDALAPMLGVWVGGYLGDYIGESAEYIGAAALAVYAVYLVVHALRTEQAGDLDHPLAILGLPLPLSVDNLLAGTGLGVMGYSAVTVAVVAGSVTLVISLVGLTLGKLAASRAPIRTDLLGGVVMLILATAMVVRA
jgi:putative Mn2+ efflux pump MntP